MPIYDITYPLTDSIACWPGDVPYTRQINMRLSEGDSVNLSAITMSVHTGTHADAPSHYDENGYTVEKLDLEVLIGKAVVVEVSGVELITIEHLAEIALRSCPRLLLKTGGWVNRTQFPESIPTLAEDVPDYLHQQRVRLIGFDLPSVDALDSKTLPIHHALGRHNITILENLNLEEVPPGTYELIALPLKIEGADGSPVRAVLRS
jgi:arylformamidase